MPTVTILREICKKKEEKARTPQSKLYDKFFQKPGPVHHYTITPRMYLQKFLFNYMYPPYIRPGDLVNVNMRRLSKITGQQCNRVIFLRSATKILGFYCTLSPMSFCIGHRKVTVRCSNCTQWQMLNSGLKRVKVVNRPGH
jgi:hypothetical protein